MQLRFLLAFGVGQADACVQPDNLILDQNNDTMTQYFIKCDEYSASQQVSAHPLKEQEDEIEK